MPATEDPICRLREGNIAPFEQAAPAQYPGVRPEKIEGEVLLFILREDISEMENVAEAHPDIDHALRQECEDFAASLDLQGE